MIIKWYNEQGRERKCCIVSIDDIQKYTEEGLYCLQIREDKVLFGGILGKFKSAVEQEQAYNDVINAINSNIEEFVFRPVFYSN